MPHKHETVRHQTGLVGEIILSPLFDPCVHPFYCSPPHPSLNLEQWSAQMDSRMRSRQLKLVSRMCSEPKLNSAFNNKLVFFKLKVDLKIENQSQQERIFFWIYRNNTTSRPHACAIDPNIKILTLFKRNGVNSRAD